MMNRFLVISLSVIAFTAVFIPRPEETDKTAVASDRSATHDEPARQAALNGSDSAGAMVLHRDSSGQFHTTARINGLDTRVLVDTGADVVALTVEDAGAMGIELSEDDFQPIMRTASGVGYGAPVMLDRVEIGENEFRNVEAVVVQGLGTNLLGQSVLRRLGKVELQGDRMVLRAI